MIKKIIKNFDIAQIADSGQCFRINPCDGGYIAIADGKILRVYQDGETISFDCSMTDFESYWSNYFDLNTDYELYIKSIPSDDDFLTSAAKYGGGIRILNQPKFETLISFIISQRKSIPAIKSAVESLCRNFGEQIDDELYAFPSAQTLASCSEDELSKCGLGYRIPYVKKASIASAEGNSLLEGFEKLTDEELTDGLLKLHGVGVKVANCVMLFAYHRIAAFPEDVWIKRTVDTYYGGNFDTKIYDGYAGVMQQYMFYYIRSLNR